MEEELNYSTVVFKNGGKPPKVHQPEKNEDSTIYSTVKSKGPPTTVPTDGEAAAHSHHSCLLVVCLVILGVLLVTSISAIICISMVMKEQKANYKANLINLTTEYQQLMMENSVLENMTEQLSRDRDDLNWTLSLILKFNTFPVNEYCPEKKCQPCQKGWILFQEKCYLFYTKYPWLKWQESQKYCQKTAAHLVVIDNLQEQEFIANHSKYYYDRYHGYWIGLHQTSDTDWLWVDGRNDTLGYWMKDYLGDNGPCALMIPGKNPTASWDPAHCAMYNKFICESEVLTRSN
ncbi:C-type lectin domain family 4 member A-like isoform X1 [Seriola lalandi dorsalis]|uniref:C-type lectin domain family 4 member A-like isoform X1 n=1 Tax=Seriola lalandi dorsalis TaxID=1841481 RepID=UPI000C6F7844|nr:C-type lectin domain family 4 member A-like isoform X1 [Seriola lalandi dorsalis]